MLITQRLTLHEFNANEVVSVVVNPHQWVMVPNPVSKQALLQACDNCGVVKSENTLMKNCAAEPDQHIITSALMPAH